MSYDLRGANSRAASPTTAPTFAYGRSTGEVPSRNSSPTRINNVLGSSFTGRGANYPRGLNVSATSSFVGIPKSSPVEESTAPSKIAPEATARQEKQTAASQMLVTSYDKAFTDHSHSHHGAAITSFEELTKRIAALNVRLSTIEQRELEGLNTANRTLTSIFNNVGQMGSIVSNLEIKLSKDLAFLEEDIEQKLKEEEIKRGEMERVLHRTIRDELEALRIMAKNNASINGVESSASSPLLTASSAQQTNFLESSSLPARGMASSSSTLNTTSIKSMELKELALKLNVFADSIDSRAAAIKKDIEINANELKTDVQRVLSSLEAHRKHRDNSERALVDMIENTCVALRKEIEDEKRQRVESHKQLERVLLEAASRQWTRA